MMPEFCSCKNFVNSWSRSCQPEALPRRTGRRLTLEFDVLNDSQPSSSSSGCDAHAPDYRLDSTVRVRPDIPRHPEIRKFWQLFFPYLGGCMSDHVCAQRHAKRRGYVAGLASLLATLCPLVVIALMSGNAVKAAPVVNVRAIPAFARKYGMPCSSCHEAWPKLSPFGQMFKDNGYQLMNDRDAPIYQQPAYWPVTFRMTTFWHRENTNRLQVDDPTSTTGGQIEANYTAHGFDYSGLDFHTGGTVAKNISFYLLPSSDPLGNFHFETVMVRLDNLAGSSWINVKLGKFELDNLLSEKRILTISSHGGFYLYFNDPPATENPGFFTTGIGNNQIGAEWMGHSKDDRTRLSAAVLSSTDGNPTLPTSRGYDTFLAGSQAFEVGGLGVQRVGAFAYFGQAPTYYQLNEGGAPVPGTGIGNKGYYRLGLIGMWYFKKLDFTTMYFHGSDSAYLGTNTAANQALPTGARNPTWNGALIETHYTYSPQIILINRYEAIRMTQQALPVVAGVGFVPGVSVPSTDFGNIDAVTFGFRYYPFISTRAGFAYHSEYSWVRQRGTSPVTGQDLTGSSLMFGFDFDF